MLFCFCVTWLNLSFEVMREALCVGIYLNALLLLKKKKYVKYFLLGAIMMGIHWFSFVIVLATPIVVLFNSKLLYSFVITMSVLILTYVNADTFYVLDLLASDSLSADASERISVYINQNEDNLYNVNGLIRLLSVSVLLPVITAYHCNKKNNGDDKLFVKLLALFVFFGVLQTKLVLFARFLNYFYLME